MKKTVSFSLDVGPLLHEVRTLQAAEIPHEAAQLLLALLEAPAKLCRFKNSPASEGTNVTALLEPTDLLLDLAAAVRAGDIDRFIVEGKRHLPP